MIVCGDKEDLSKSFDRLEVAELPYTSLSDGYTAYERFMLQKVSYGYLEREGLFKKVPGDFAKVTNSLFMIFMFIFFPISSVPIREKIKCARMVVKGKHTEEKTISQWLR